MHAIHRPLSLFQNFDQLFGSDLLHCLLEGVIFPNQVSVLTLGIVPGNESVAPAQTMHVVVSRFGEDI